MYDEKFEKIFDKPITGVSIAKLKPISLDIDKIFFLLPITPIDESRIIKRNGKIILPLCKPGSIISVRYRGYTRGFVKSSVPKWFLHVVIVDISLKEKNISVKISNDNLHFCGIHGHEMIDEFIGYFNEHLQRISIELMRIEKYNILQGNKSYSFDGEKIVDDFLIHPMEYSSEEYKRGGIFKTMLDQCTHVSNFKLVRDWICDINFQMLKVDKITDVMYNYNYHPGFSYSRIKLSKFIDRSKFRINFKNSLQTIMSIKILIGGKLTSKRKEKSHTFLITKSGCVTQSGPNAKSMKDVFIIFCEELKRIRPLIETREKIDLPEGKNVVFDDYSSNHI